MIPDYILDLYPKDVDLKGGWKCLLRPLENCDERNYFEFFQSIPEQERVLIRHQVSDPEVIRAWCRHIDLERNFPLLALAAGQILGVGTLHQKFGGWRSHVGSVSVFVRPGIRGHGLARTLVSEVVELARQLALEKVEAEFIGEQKAAIEMFAFMGFSNLMRLREYVKDLKGDSHDYILMGQDLITDEEYAGMG